MFLADELFEATQSEAFQVDMRWIRQGMASLRVGEVVESNCAAWQRLDHFIECVLSSAPDWTSELRFALCRQAAEAAEVLAHLVPGDRGQQRRRRLRAAILYGLAGLPAMSSGVLDDSDLGGALSEMLSGDGRFASLNAPGNADSNSAREREKALDALAVADLDAAALARYERGEGESERPAATLALAALARDFSLGLRKSELDGLAALFPERASRATRRHVHPSLFEILRATSFPPELFPAQTAALSGGMLDDRHESWGLASPTGTGKTYLARLLITAFLERNASRSVVYVVPTRALVHEVTESLASFFRGQEIKVNSISAQLVSPTEEEEALIAESHVLVLTPEKADLLLRIGSTFLSRVGLVIVDEAHLIGSGTRGALLEFYLWRIRRLVTHSRIVLLSAVTPNIAELARWIGGHSASVTVSQRPTRMRTGVYRVHESGKASEGWVEYDDGTRVKLFGQGAIATGKSKQLVQLVDRVACAGPVLVVARGKKSAENLAEELLRWKTEREPLFARSISVSQHEALARLDSRLEREMYPDVPMREFIRHRIAYHHAGLPPRVRIAVEDAIRVGCIDFVFATTTLAEGVNFPFSSVVVQSLSLRGAPEKGKPPRYAPITPRSFWNIAGRAGRPGVDSEGQAILFAPSLGLRETDPSLEEYLDSSLASLEPVRSGLGAAVSEIRRRVDSAELDLTDIEQEVLPERVSRVVQGAVNLIRIALVHASAAKIDTTSERAAEETLAYMQADEETEKQFIRSMFRSQESVVETFLARPGAPSREMVAELGLSISTLADLRDYVARMADWKIEDMGRLFFGGRVNLATVQYVLAPVCKRMAELEGPELGGLYGEVAADWVSGISLAGIFHGGKHRRWKRLEDLIAVMHTRVQYLLPWGLFAFDALLSTEANSRGISYDNQVRTLSYLTDAGVPSIDALRLVGVDFERVDATRLATAYEERGGRGLGVDVFGWVLTQPRKSLETIVRGIDDRTLDYDFDAVLRLLRHRRPVNDPNA